MPKPAQVYSKTLCPLIEERPIQAHRACIGLQLILKRLPSRARNSSRGVRRLGSGPLTGLVLAIYAWGLRACGHLAYQYHVTALCTSPDKSHLGNRTNLSPDITGKRGTSPSLLQLHTRTRRVEARIFSHGCKVTSDWLPSRVPGLTPSPALAMTSGRVGQLATSQPSSSLSNTTNNLRARP